MTPSRRSRDSASRLAELLLAIPPGRRGSVMQCVVSFRANPTLEASFALGPVRALFAEFWEARVGSPIPISELRAILDVPVPIGTVLEFNKLAIPSDATELDDSLTQLIRHLRGRLRKLEASRQLSLFNGAHQRQRLTASPGRPAERCKACRNWWTKDKSFRPFTRIRRGRMRTRPREPRP